MVNVFSVTEIEFHKSFLRFPTLDYRQTSQPIKSTYRDMHFVATLNIHKSQKEDTSELWEEGRWGKFSKRGLPLLSSVLCYFMRMDRRARFQIRSALAELS